MTQYKNLSDCHNNLSDCHNNLSDCHNNLSDCQYARFQILAVHLSILDFWLAYLATVIL